jgi:hypothetical protein
MTRSERIAFNTHLMNKVMEHTPIMLKGRTDFYSGCHAGRMAARNPNNVSKPIFAHSTPADYIRGFHKHWYANRPTNITMSQHGPSNAY